MEEQEPKEVSLNPDSLGLTDNNYNIKKLLIIGGISILVLAIITTIVLVITLNNKDEDKKDTKPKPRSLIDLDELNKYPTPYYYYNTSLLNETINEALRLAKKHDLKIHFSLKSNFNKKIVKLFASHPEIGADCVSGGEVDYAFEFFKPEDIVFAGIGKTDDEIKNAVEKGIFCINVESYEELDNLNEICKSLKKKMNFATRINPNIVAHTHEKIITGLNENKFGIYLDEDENRFYNTIKNITSNVENRYEYLNFIGLHFHIGSNILNFTDYVPLCEKIDKYIEKLNSLNISITYLNLGGGLGVDYDEPVLNPIPDFEGFFNTYLTNITSLQKIGKNNFNQNKTIRLHFELGRSMIAQSGYVISKVNYIKHGVEKNFAILDAGMNDLIRPAMYDALHQIERVVLTEDKEMYDVVGPICESSDVFAKNYTMGKLYKGDYVLIRSAGAYGESMASRYNFRKLIEGYLDYELY